MEKNYFLKLSETSDTCLMWTVGWGVIKLPLEMHDQQVRGNFTSYIKDTILQRHNTSLCSSPLIKICSSFRTSFCPSTITFWQLTLEIKVEFRENYELPPYSFFPSLGSAFSNLEPVWSTQPNLRNVPFPAFHTQPNTI